MGAQKSKEKYSVDVDVDVEDNSDSGDPPPPPPEDSDSDVVIDIYEADGDVSSDSDAGESYDTFNEEEKHFSGETPRKGRRHRHHHHHGRRRHRHNRRETGRKSRLNPVTMRCQKFHQSCPPQARSDPLGHYAARIDPVLTLMQHRN